ncbi:hypothetical protein ACE6H2_017515 [Prunus campanulata]
MIEIFTKRAFGWRGATLENFRIGGAQLRNFNQIHRSFSNFNAIFDRHTNDVSFKKHCFQLVYFASAKLCPNLQFFGSDLPIFLVDLYEFKDPDFEHVGAFQFQFVFDGGAARDLHVHVLEDAVPGRSRAENWSRLELPSSWVWWMTLLPLGTGERLSPWVAAGCFTMGISILFF